MKETQIKIADLLLSVGSTDTVSVKGVFIPRIIGLQKWGVTLTVFLQSIDANTIVVTIEKLHCFLDDISDISWQSFVREVVVSDYVGKFVLDDSHLIDDGDDPLFCIPWDYIDMEEMIYQAIQLQEPLVKRTKEEQIAYDAIADNVDVDDEIQADWFAGWVVTIR